jgi:thiamine biosynthesis lipoprotein
VTSTGQAIATSSTQRRVWQTDDGPRHHIVDPRTGRTASTVWSQVSCAATSCLEANAASTAAIVLGADAPDWLVEHGIPARLETLDGHVVTTPGWPDASTRGA